MTLNKINWLSFTCNQNNDEDSPMHQGSHHDEDNLSNARSEPAIWIRRQEASPSQVKELPTKINNSGKEISKLATHSM